MFNERKYKKKIFESSVSMANEYGNAAATYDVTPYLEMLHPIPAPTEV